MKNLLYIISFVLIIILAILLDSCKKSDSGSGAGSGSPYSTASYQVRMTDTPGNYEAVNIDLKAVAVTGKNNNEVFLNVNAGMYNLLNYANGTDTLIASGNIDAGSVSQIRLILGPNSYIVENGDTFPLSTPSAEQSGLKIQVHHDVQAGVKYLVLLDFDANQSIVKTGNGSYKLKPVIRSVEKAISGSIKGSIMPASALASVTATNTADNTSFSTVTDLQGRFLVMGVPNGTYDVRIKPLTGTELIVKNVTVVNGKVTDMGTVNL